MIEKAKNIVWVLIGIFGICGFIQTLLTLNPRVTRLEEEMTQNPRVTRVEERVSYCESQLSGVKITLDTIVKQNVESSKDIKDIYHLIMERHSK